MSCGDEGQVALHPGKNSMTKLMEPCPNSSSGCFPPPINIDGEPGSGKSGSAELIEGSETALLAKLRVPPHPNSNRLPGGISSKTRQHKPRRVRIPNRPDISISLWGIIKNAIGKDLSKLPLPVNFNEPLSMLQRLTEDYEYSGVLDNAAEAHNGWDQMAWVAAFSISSYASTAVRTGKPFNPPLGETFECDRMSDMGFKCFCEQVSHHPPTVAVHCIGHKWTCWQEFTMTSRFTGNSIEVTPHGVAHLMFHDNGN